MVITLCDSRGAIHHGLSEKPPLDRAVQSLHGHTCDHHGRCFSGFKVQEGLSLPLKSLWSGTGKDCYRSNDDARQSELGSKMEVSDQKMNSEVTQDMSSGQRKRDRREKRQPVCLVNLPCLVLT